MNLNKITLALTSAGLMMLGAQTQAMTLQDYVADSIQAHPEVREHLHHFRQVQQDQTIASSGWRPRVDLEASTGRYWTKSPGTLQQREDYDSSRGALTLTQNLFSGFDTSAQIDQNEARLQAAKYMLLHEANSVALEAVRAYLDVLKQAQMLKLAQENVATHEAILNSVQDRFRSGVGRRSELEQTRGRVASAHASLIAQQNNLQDAITVAHRVLGRYVDASELNDPNLPVPKAAKVEELIEHALSEHPSLRVAMHNVDASLAEHRRARSANYPQLDLILQKQLGDNLGGVDGRTDDHSVVLNMRYNLYRGGADLATQRRSISGVHQQQASGDRVRRQLIESVRFAAIADTALQEQIVRLEEHHNMASRSAASFREEFLIGQRSLLDVLDSENERNIAHNRLVDAKYDSILARYRVYEAAGQLFGALNLDVDVQDDNLHIITIQANERDHLPLNDDRDADGRIQWLDECDNSLPDAKVDHYGCDRDANAAQTGSERIAVPAHLEELLHKRIEAFMVEPLNFQFDSAELTSDSRPMLNGIITRLKGVTGPIEVRAHTDSLGSDDYNMSLSMRRAQRIKDHLVEAGINASRITAVGAGARMPVTRNDNQDGRASNRRVEFFVQPNLPDEIPALVNERLFFMPGVTELTADSRRNLSSIATQIRESGKQHVEIRAYTDNSTQERGNTALSQQRADAMRDLLLNQGLHSVKFNAVGLNSRHPVTYGNSTAELTRNRRAEIYLYN